MSHVEVVGYVALRSLDRVTLDLVLNNLSTTEEEAMRQALEEGIADDVDPDSDHLERRPTDYGFLTARVRASWLRSASGRGGALLLQLDQRTDYQARDAN